MKQFNGPVIGTRVPSGTYDTLFVKGVTRLGPNLFLVKYTKDKLGKSKVHKYGIFTWTKLNHQPYRGDKRPMHWRNLAPMGRYTQYNEKVWRIWSTDQDWDRNTHRRMIPWIKVDATVNVEDEARAVDLLVRCCYLVHSTLFDKYLYHDTETFSVSSD